MLEKYIRSKNEIFLPDLEERYFIKITGEIIDTRNNDFKVILPDSTRQVEITYNRNLVTVPLSWIIAMAFKPLYRSRSFALNWEIEFADGNVNNLHPKNLLWKPPIGGQECPELSGFYIIPGISNAAINDKGILYSRIHDRYLAVRESSNGYLVFNARTDNFSSDIISESLQTFGVHRALGLAMIPFNDWQNVEKHQINHCDGIKLNNQKNNLEWMTNGENVSHAYANGLNSQKTTSIPVSVFNKYTNETFEYASVIDACNTLKIGRSTLFELAKSGKCDNLGNTYKVNRFRLREDRTCVAVSLEANVNGERNIIIAPSPFAMAKLTNTTVDKINTALSTGKQFPSDNYVYYLKTVYDQLTIANKIRQFTDLEIEAFRDRSGITRPILVTWLDSGKKEVFKSTVVFDKYLISNPELKSRFLSRSIYAGYHGKYFNIDYIEE